MKTSLTTKHIPPQEFWIRYNKLGSLSGDKCLSDNEEEVKQGASMAVKCEKYKTQRASFE